MFDWVFAFLHLGALLAALGYAVYCLIRGRVAAAAVIILLVGAYYYFVLHPAVLKEAERRRKAKAK
ncbi:MAG TPA: hypothetical protein VMS75_12100 [Terriglobales bacterium]|nr:hypothetical protein [Terriglobales bacterium]